MVMHYYWPAYT